MKVADMHCDTISRLLKKEKNSQIASLLRNDLHIDLWRMQKGDYLLQNFAMFVNLAKVDDPLVETLEMCDVFYRQMTENKEYILPVFKYDDILKNQKQGKMSALLTLEEGGALKGNPYILRNFYNLGVRMITLTWNYENEIGFPNTCVNNPDYDCNKRYGLKDKGIELVKEMNRLGIIVDVSHLGDDGFWDVVKYCDGPFVASHSNCRSLCSHTRNLTDEMIKALAEKGGVAGINFYSAFLNKNGTSTAKDMVCHMKHMKKIGGIGCVGLGTDFDGIDGNLEIDSADKMQLLANEMEKQGFTASEIEAVFYKNVLRVYREVL